MFFKICVLDNFAILTGKHVLESLFNKVAGLKTCNFIKKRLQHRCFSVNIASFFKEHLRRPLLIVVIQGLTSLIVWAFWYQGFVCGLRSFNVLDHNECNTTSHQCQQKCVNEYGGYSCDCLKGFQINNDRRTCSG